VDEQLRELVQSRYPILLRRAYLLTGDLTVAEDVVQEALYKCCRAWRRGRVDDPDAYLQRTLVNMHISLRRRLRPVAVRHSVEPYVGDGSQDRAEQEAMWQLLQSAPRRQRVVLVLRYYEGLTESEIAESLGVTVGTVRSQAAKGLNHLREAVRDELVSGRE
jgi:RNA polymerase sigma-70 factor (sigma-E family)